MASENETLAAQLTALRKEMATLAEHVGALAGKRGKAAAHDLADGVSEAMGYVNGRAQTADLRVESAVAANPYLALGLAAGVGLLLGALTRR